MTYAQSRELLSLQARYTAPLHPPPICSFLSHRFCTSSALFRSEEKRSGIIVNAVALCALRDVLRRDTVRDSLRRHERARFGERFGERERFGLSVGERERFGLSVGERERFGLSVGERERFGLPVGERERFGERIALSAGDRERLGNRRHRLVFSLYVARHGVGLPRILRPTEPLRSTHRFVEWLMRESHFGGISFGVLFESLSTYYFLCTQSS